MSGLVILWSPLFKGGGKIVVVVGVPKSSVAIWLAVAVNGRGFRGVTAIVQAALPIL